MSLTTVYCTRTNVDDIWSDVGANARLCDDGTGQEKSGLMDRFIKQATDRVNFFCLERYSAASLAASDYIIDATAVIACYKLATRRGNPCPQSLLERYQEVIEELQSIKAGQFDVPGADVKFSDIPAMSNLTWDGRYQHAKVRVQPTISTGGNPVNVPQNRQIENTLDGQV